MVALGLHNGIASYRQPVAMPQPLPPNPYNTGQQAVLHAAYKRCVILQNSHSEVGQRGRLSVLICARLLGYMILEAPTDEGRTEFVSEIVRCVDDMDLQKLAEVYKNHLLRLCKLLSSWLCPLLTINLSPQFAESRAIPQRLVAIHRPPLLMHKQLASVYYWRQLPEAMSWPRNRYVTDFIKMCWFNFVPRLLNAMATAVFFQEDLTANLLMKVVCRKMMNQ